jgi:hypothetical protein
MTASGIKSKPVYSPLSVDTDGRYHVMLGLGTGSEPLLRVLGEMQAAAPALLTQTQVLLSAGAGTVDGFAAFGLADVRRFAERAALLDECRALLERSLMGTRLYVAGPESFIGLALRIALEFNLNKDEIRAEAVGTLARRVYCVHCRTTTEDVRTNVAQCSGCSRWLTVRDHYSRRLAAYMGVMADAEAPGELPPIREVFA